MVGKIPTCIDDDFLEKLLAACGPVREWKRVVDPVNKQAKPFGFCTWSTPQGAMCALRLIHGLAVEDGVLELKPGKASEQLMDDWLARGNVFRELDAEEARQRIQEVLDTRAALPQRTREMLKLEMERSEKRRKPSGREAEASKEAAKESQLKRKREERRRERDRRAQERAQMEARAHDLEKQWEERERSNERSRSRRQRDFEDERTRERKQAAQNEADSSVMARRTRVLATAKARERERREDAEARKGRLVFSGTTSLLQNRPEATASGAATASGLSALGGGAMVAPLFASQEEEDQEEDAARLRQQMQARQLFVPVDTLYRRKLSPAEVEEIVQSIPKLPAELYAHSIDWAFLGTVGAMDDTGQVREFVKKNITELVGEMADMVDFVMVLLRKRVAPADLEARMGMVLQEDAPKFVVKLWRFLAYLVKAEQRQRDALTTTS